MNGRLSFRTEDVVEIEHRQRHFIGVLEVGREVIGIGRQNGAAKVDPLGIAAPLTFRGKGAAADVDAELVGEQRVLLDAVPVVDVFGDFVGEVAPARVIAVDRQLDDIVVPPGALVLALGSAKSIVEDAREEPESGLSRRGGSRRGSSCRSSRSDFGLPPCSTCSPNQDPISSGVTAKVRSYQSQSSSVPSMVMAVGSGTVGMNVKAPLCANALAAKKRPSARISGIRFISLFPP